MGVLRMVSAICLLTAIPLVAISLFTPWYHVHDSWSGFHGLSGETDHEFWLDYVTYDSEMWGGILPLGWTWEYDDLPLQETGGVFLATRSLVFVSLTLLSITFLFTLLVRKQRLFVAILGILVLMTTASCPIYFSSAIPDALETDSEVLGLPTISGFSGSDEYTFMSGETTWGPGPGWFLILAASVLILVSVLLSLLLVITERRKFRTRRHFSAKGWR